MSTSVQVVIDTADPARLAEFWAAALGYILQPPPPGFDSWDAWADEMGIPEENRNDANAVVDPDGNGPRIFFQRVPEAKTVKNRVHLDLGVSGGHRVPPDERRRRVDAEVVRLKELGASMHRPMEQRGEYWVVMSDPEGNEFCVQ